MTLGSTGPYDPCIVSGPFVKYLSNIFLSLLCEVCFKNFFFNLCWRLIPRFNVLVTFFDITVSLWPFVAVLLFVFLDKCLAVKTWTWNRKQWWKKTVKLRKISYKRFSTHIIIIWEGAVLDSEKCVSLHFCIITLLSKLFDLVYGLACDYHDQTYNIV